MKHNVYGKHLSRSTNARTQLFRNLVRSLILHESINTTEAKAKAIKGLVDKLVTQAKTPASRRLVSQFLVEKDIAEKLVKDIAPRLSGRKSGYTSIVKLDRRLGDGTMMVQMRLLVEESKEPSKDKKKGVTLERSDRVPEVPTESRTHDEVDDSIGESLQNDKKTAKPKTKKAATKKGEK